MGFDPICGMHVGLQGFSCLVLCGFIKLNPHKVGVTVSGVPAQTGSYPILKCRTATVAAARSLQNPYSPQNPYASLLRFFASAREAARDATLEPAEAPVASAEPG